MKVQQGNEEQHYSHVVPKMFSNELSGVDFEKDQPKKKRKALNKKSLAKITEQMKTWEAEFKIRGCI